MARFRMKTPTDIRRTLQRVANMVLEGELDTKQANAIIYACNSTLQSIRTDNDEAKLKELALTVEEMQARWEAENNNGA